MAKKLRQMTSDALDLPKDVIFDLPRMTMIGNMQLYIENHKGIQHFSGDRLCLQLSVGSIEVTGKNLVIRAILSEEVFIEGTIEQVKYIRGNSE